MIVRIASAAVPQSKLEAYLQYVQNDEISSYEAAEGLTSVVLLQRSFVAYVELATVSMWQSEDALQRFLNSCVPPERDWKGQGVIPLEERVYESVMVGKSASPNPASPRGTEA